MDAAGWDARYAGPELVWDAHPNAVVAAELDTLPAGRALDLGCGEGRHAIWLATRGWTATGVDFSAVALDRAARLADGAGVADRCTWRRGDAATTRFPEDSFDAVVVAYLHLPAGTRREAHRNVAAALAPGGVLLVLAHDTTNLTDGVGGPQDPEVLFTPADVVADLADLPGLVVDKAERITRPVEGHDGHPAIDALVRIHRTT